jgi:hypothetical protein
VQSEDRHSLRESSLVDGTEAGTVRVKDINDLPPHLV